MANEFVARNGIIANDNSRITGTLDVSGNISSGGNTVATQTWVTATALSGFATESYVTTAISNLIDAAPGTLNTLNELAAALGDDPNFATTITNSIATKLPLAGGNMTGNINWTSTDKGLVWTMNTDGAYIKFFNTGDGDTNSRLEYATSDNGNEYHRFLVSGVERMAITASGISATGYNKSNWDTAYGWGNHGSAGYVTRAVADTLYQPVGSYAAASHTHSATDITSGTLASARLSGTYAINISGSAATLTTARTIALSGDVTGSASFNGSANVTITATVANNSHTHQAEDVTGGVLGNAGKIGLANHPEGGGLFIPSFDNDLAFIQQRGGSVTFYKTTDTTYTAQTLTNSGAVSFDPDVPFNGSTNYAYASLSSLSEIVVCDIEMPFTLTYGNTFYIDFGNAVWAAKDVSFYAYQTANNAEATYKLVGGAIVNNTQHLKFTSGGYTHATTSGGTGYGYNRLRVVMTNWTNTGPRIAAIGTRYYNSTSLTQTLLSKAGGTLYGDLSFNDTNTVLKEGSGNAVRIQTNTGYVDIGSMNSGWVHFQADRSVYMWANGGSFSFDADVTPYNNTKSLGTSSARWSTVYGTNGDFSGALYVGTTIVDPSGVSGFAAGHIAEGTTGFSAPGIAIGSTTGQHGAIVYGSNTMYFGTETGSDNTLNTRMTLNSSGTLNVTGNITIGGVNVATTTFASDEAAAVQDNLDSLVGSLGTAAYTASTAYAPASHTHSYLPLSGGTLTGDLQLSANQLLFNTGNVAAPSTTDQHAGTRILLYPNPSGSHYAIGIESSNMWFNSDGGYKWYNDSVNIASLSLSGVLYVNSGNSAQWNSAYSWGNHASAGYGSAGDTAKGVEAFGWGDHAAAGYLTSESDTLATVTGRGASTSSKVFFTHNTTADPLSAVEINGGGNHTGLYINPAAARQAHVRFGTNGTLKWQIRAPFQDSADTALKFYSWVSGDDKFVFNHNGSATFNGGTVWTSANDGAGSGLDADTLDGLQASEFGSAGDTAKGVEAFGWGNHAGLYAAASHTHAYLPLSGGTLTGQVIFPSAATTKPVLPNGFISRNDLDDTSGRHDIWGISERYYPSNPTAGDAWGIQWSGTPNDIVFVGAGTDRVSISLDEGNITTLGTVTASGGNSGNWNTAYSWGNHATAGYITDGNTNWNNTYGFITASSTDTLTNKSGNISQWTNNSGYITASASITGNAATATKLATARSIALAGDVTGSANFDGSANISITATVADDSHTHDGRYYTESESDARFVNVTGDTVTGNLAVSGASLSVTSTAAGSEAFYVDGVNGRLFTISDDLSDSLFSVNTISGLPVIEAFADNTVKIGPFSNPVTVDSSGVLAIGGVTAATQTYVDNAISGLIGGAPGALDTLNELAAAINDDASYASTITTALGTKAPLASPALTGTPTAPTAAAATNSTQIATTAFVKSQGYLTSLGFNYGTGVTANYVVQRDANGYIYANYVNLAINETENPTVNSFIVSNGDGWTRKASVAHIKSTLGLGSAAYTASTDYAAASHTHTFASLTSKPTTLSGYGITDAASSTHTHTFASLTSVPTTLAGYGITDAASSSHNHDSRYMRADTDANTAGAIRINGSYSYGTYTAASNYKTGADNLVLKGNASGVSGIFFESEKDGTNINHPSDFGFIQYSAYGTATSGESNELIIGVSNDADDHLVFNAPDTNGLKFRIGASTTDNTVYHSGNLTLATLGYTGATNANYITNNNQLTNGAGYITGYTETDTLASVIGRGNLFGTSNQGYVTANAGTYASELRKIRRITMSNGSSNWDNDNHCFISTDSAGNFADSLSINSYNDITLRIDTNNNNSASYVRFGQHGTGASTYYFVSGYDGAEYITTITGHVVPGGDRLYDMGQPDNRWRIIFCETLDSAGLHESNLASDTTGFHATGTVLVWKDGEAVPCSKEADHMKIGIAVFGNSSPLVQGAEPVLVSGGVTEGDYLITSEVIGHAKAVSRSYVVENQLLDCVIGKALETASGESHLVKTWVTI